MVTWVAGAAGSSRHRVEVTAWKTTRCRVSPGPRCTTGTASTV